MRNSIVAILFSISVGSTAGALEHNCLSPESMVKPSDWGEALVQDARGDSHSLFWIKIAAPEPPTRGTIFYLAGGPLSHLNYTNLAAQFQATAFSNFDLILYDYYGFNCSTPIQDYEALKQNFHKLTMPAMASDFIQLKNSLLGHKAKAYLMGGSHGAMLGAQILQDYPDHIEKAILFSGDTQSGWLANGWFRFDRLLYDLESNHPGFVRNLSELLSKAEKGELQLSFGEEKLSVDRASLEVGLWLAFSQSAGAQAQLPHLVELALNGDVDWIAAIYLAQIGLLVPIEKELPPTDVSLVINFHRCNIWFPKSERASSSVPLRKGVLLNYNSFVGYWNALCREYDGLGEFPFYVKPDNPVDVPLLSWVGDQDMFDTTQNQKNWEDLSSKLQFHRVPGWSHDFGEDGRSGFQKAANWIKEFLSEDLQ